MEHYLPATVYQIRAFLLGLYEFRSKQMTDPGLLLVDSYEAGRELAHRLTFHYFDF